MNNQLQTLKLNVTNINSYLMRSNNQLQKLKKNKNQLLFKLERQSIGRRKETRIEKGLIGKGLMKTGSKLLSPAMSIFDKIKEFFGIVILGFIVNKLPKIIKAITDFLDSEFVKNLKSVVSVIGDTFTTLYNIVIDFPQSIKDNFTEGIEYIQGELDWLNKTFGTESDLFKGISSLILGDPIEDGENMIMDTPFMPENLAQVIARGEGGLNSVNMGTAGDTPGGAKKLLGKNLTDMTLDEIYAAQRSDKVFAVGKYQIIPDTMPGFLRYLLSQGIDTSKTKFDEKTQDMFMKYLIDEKRPIIGQYLRGETDNRSEAIQELAREFASIGLEYSEAGRVRGESRYSGTGGNKASISPVDVGKALDKERKLRMQPVEPVKKRDPNLRSSLVNSSGTGIAFAVLPIEKEVVVTETEIQMVPMPIETVTTIPEEWEVG